MQTTKNRRRYTKEFKLEAIQLVESRGGKVTEVARNLGIHPNLLHSWIRAYADEPEHAFPGNGKLKAPDAELHDLRKQVRELQEERAILKKALAIFSRAPE